MGLTETKQLHKDRNWQILLHYKGTISGTKSLIDDPAFFLSSKGRTNPRSELRETIKGFFQEGTPDKEHPRCRFPARYSWLKERLDIDESKLPTVQCRDFQEAVNRIKPRMSALVFPTAFMNRPASMFGHTFIRIDSDYESKLLSHAVNYSAFTGDTGEFLYILKGLLGYYKGYFSVLPYYEKVKEYNDIEQRDMWEYNLNLSEEELQRMLMHIWELKDIYSYYYFFDENCSYNILFLFEAGRPSINLTDNRKLWVIPLDTIREVKAAGLVGSVDYRPSKATVINHIASLLDEAGQIYALKIIDGKETPGNLIKGTRPEEEKIKILDLGAEMLQYRYLKNEMTKEEYLKRFISVLTARSRLGRGEGLYKIERPPEPDKGHRSARLGLGAGVKKDRFFQEIRLRPAYHDLLDPDDGYLEGSQIVFADIRARYYDKDKRLLLEGIDFIDIISISPRDKFFKPVSWKISTGVSRKLLGDGKDHLTYYLNGGMGLAYRNRLVGICYALAEADVNAGSSLHDKYSAGYGISAGILRRIKKFYKVNVSLTAMHYRLGDEHETYTAEVAQNFRISQNNSITALFSRVKTYKIYEGSAGLYWNFYF